VRRRAGRAGRSADQGNDLTLLHPIAALDEDRVDVAQNLRADVGLFERAQIHRSLDFDGNVARDNLGDHDRRRKAPLGRTARFGFAHPNAASATSAKKTR
jgi:hypothetical protein